jgi:hypothetical protein
LARIRLSFAVFNGTRHAIRTSLKGLEILPCAGLANLEDMVNLVNLAELAGLSAKLELRLVDT